MSNDAANQLMMFSAEALTTALLLLGLFRMRSRLGLAPLYVTLGVFQPIQVLLASSVYVEVLPGLVISPGSVIMFTASLFAVLLVYIREDAIEARKVIYGIMVANLTMTLLLLVFGVQLGFPDTLNFLGLPREIFNQGARVMLAGTIALFGDVILVIFVYEAVRRFIPRIPFLRIYLTMAIILTFDTLVFATGAFYGQPNYRSIVLAGVVGKVGMAAFYAAALTIYLRFLEPADRVSSAAGQPFRDIFYALTYREKYEIERERAEETLRESEEKYRQLVELAQEGIWLIDKDSCTTFVNPSMAEMLGYSSDEMIGKHLFYFMDERGIEIAARNVERRQAGISEQHDFEFLHKDGSCIYTTMEVAPVTDKEGHYAGAIAGVIDITERVQAREALRESETRYRLISTVASDYMFSTRLGIDGKLALNWVAGAFESITGYTFEEYIALGGWRDALHPDDLTVDDRDMEKLCTNQPVITEVRTLTKSGKMVWVRVYAQPVWDAEREALVGIYGAVQDITERKRVGEELREYRAHLEELVEARTAELNERVTEVEGLNQAMANLLGDLQAANRKLAETGQKLQRANAELETFTYSVSHDLKAPLRGIDGYSRLLLQDYAEQLDEEGRTFLHTIRRATGQMNQLIDDLLAYSHLERRALVRGQVNPRALVEALVAEQVEEIRERGASLTVKLPCQAVIGEAEGLTQALRNLLDNALKFTRDVPEPRIEIGGRETENSCIMWVRDNGIGFDMQYHDRIFEIFQRLHRAEEYPGTGVGLAIVRKAVERMSGRVWAESAPGEGATFYLEIPR